jgi:hypothetical protein
MTGVTVKPMARGVFSGKLNPDPESAAADLRRAGYEVFHDAGQAPASSFQSIGRIFRRGPPAICGNRAGY